MEEGVVAEGNEEGGEGAALFDTPVDVNGGACVFTEDGKDTDFG